MTEQLKESLSAVMDGEADEFEIRRVLNEAAADPELRGVWERYHLVRSVMRGEGRLQRMGADALSARVWTQIDAGDEVAADESDELTNESARAPRSRWAAWGQRIAGVAVAAGVAAAVIVGFKVDDGAAVPAPKIAVTEQGPPATMALFDDEVRGQTVPAALDLQRAHAYMLHHAHHVALTNRSVVPFVKVAAFESK
jgi:sigma-E factor negative regulatory protein RseA